ncbi:MAG: hypothetical protein P1P88_08740 [Bacteroidales bacterium]|nr:hypothetical protein [Bacteroidales bacterium]
MRKTIKITLTGIFLFFFQQIIFADGGLVAFYKLGVQKGTIEKYQKKIEKALAHENFDIVGTYHPAKDANLMVIAFTRKDLIDITLEAGDRGIMAGIMRIGLVQKDNTVEISLLNPEYVFFAYLQDSAKKYEIELNQISLDIKMALIEIGDEFKPFITSSLTERELMEFRFLVRNPGFEDAVEVMKFDSFEQGVETIERNLQARKDGTYKVYELVFNKRKIALFGIGLYDLRKGEANFLDKLGKSHLAALPYELILIENKATILHGKYRFPLYWSDLSMSEYRKIYKTPRDIEETMRAITR